MPITKAPAKRMFSQSDLIEEFKAYSRLPFIEVLANMMNCMPTPESLERFANEYPDRWANAVNTMSRLAGYHDKLEITGNVMLEVQGMGDAELIAKLSELDDTLKRMEEGKMLEGKEVEYMDVSSSQEEQKNTLTPSQE